MVSKREVMLSLLDEHATLPYVPGAFFMHFGPVFREGPAAVEKHLAYFHATDMDFVKIQFEHAFPHLPEIRRPEDWRHMPLYGEDFYARALEVVEGLVQAAKAEALVIVTLYSPFMSAGHTTSDQMISEHLKTDPEAVKPGMEIITESLLTFVQACIRLGVDGFYASTQGGEAHRFEDPTLFERYIKPYDLVIMEEINARCSFNILHICDYHGGYQSLTPYMDYPGDIVNCSLNLGAERITPRQAAQMFDRPFMGGMGRHDVIVSGDEARIEARVEQILMDAPERFILGADCTVPGETPWSHLHTAIATAHRWRR